MAVSGQNSKALTQKILLTQRDDLYRRVPFVEYYQNPLRRFHLFFWNKTPHPVLSGCVEHDMYISKHLIKFSKNKTVCIMILICRSSKVVQLLNSFSFNGSGFTQAYEVIFFTSVCSHGVALETHHLLKIWLLITASLLLLLVYWCASSGKIEVISKCRFLESLEYWVNAIN